MKEMNFPNPSTYPIAPCDLAINRVSAITSHYELDSYLNQIVYFCSFMESFSFAKSEFYEYLASWNNSLSSVSNCDDRNEVLEKDYFLLRQSESNIFLTSEFIISVIGSSSKIRLKHIKFDEVPRKTEIERLSPERFMNLKALVLQAKKKNSYGPFDPEEFPNVNELSSFVEKTEKGLFITPKLLTYLFGSVVIWSLLAT